MSAVYDDPEGDPDGAVDEAEMLRASEEIELELATEYDTLPEVIRAAKASPGITFANAKKAAKDALKKKGLTHNEAFVNDEIKRVRELMRKGSDAESGTVRAEFTGFDDFGFKPMGLDGGSYYFMIGASKQIVKLSAAALTQTSGLLQLADKSRWLSSFGYEGKISIVDAADALMRSCEKCGLFDPSMVRGRGIWFDAGRAIAHLGDRLLVDGVESPLSIESKYMYVRRPSLDVDLSAPMSSAEGKRFLALVGMGAWAGGNLNARYMAGQVVCAAISGALEWRPHSWITGRPQSGKSTMISIIKAALGNMLVHALKKTTEAGIRQTLKGDALAVLCDEADTEDEHLRRIVQGVIDLARISSGEDGGQVIKGTTYGEAIAWKMRSCFIIGSVNSSLSQEADKSRFEVSELDMEKGAHQSAAEFEAERSKLLVDGFGARFCARAIAMVTTIRANAKTFTAALVGVLESQRACDLHGALLAGAYSLESDEALTLECARALVGEYGIPKVDKQAATADEDACWAYIKDCRLQVINNESRHESIPIGVLLDIAALKGGNMSAEEYEKAVAADLADNRDDISSDELIDPADALRVLKFAGFNIVDENGRQWEKGTQWIAVMNNSKEIADMLKAKPAWAADYEKVLKRLKGAKPSTGPVGFGSRDRKSRATLIPA